MYYEDRNRLSFYLLPPRGTLWMRRGLRREQHRGIPGKASAGTVLVHQNLLGPQPLLLSQSE